VSALPDTPPEQALTAVATSEASIAVEKLVLRAKNDRSIRDCAAIAPDRSIDGAARRFVEGMSASERRLRTGDNIRPVVRPLRSIVGDRRSECSGVLVPLASAIYSRVGQFQTIPAAPRRGGVTIMWEALFSRGRPASISLHCSGSTFRASRVHGLLVNVLEIDTKRGVRVPR
jgi:hypothetical protein